MTTDTIGGTSAGASNFDAFVWCFLVTASDSGILQTIGANIGTPSGNLRLALYDSDGAGGIPNTLLSQSADTPAQAGWNDLVQAAVAITKNHNYWLGSQYSTSACKVYYVAASPTAYYESWTYGAFPSSFAQTGSYAYNENMRMTYVPSVSRLQPIPMFSGILAVIAGAPKTYERFRENVLDLSVPVSPAVMARLVPVTGFRAEGRDFKETKFN
jgi:hypothetical protein